MDKMGGAWCSEGIAESFYPSSLYQQHMWFMEATVIPEA